LREKVAAELGTESLSYDETLPDGANHSTQSTHHEKRYGSGGDFWFSQIRRQGFSPYQPNSSYVIYRNVRDYGAKGRLGRSLSQSP